MIISTAPFIAGYRVAETRGQVFGLVVRSRGLGGNIMAGLRSIVGGEIHEYTSLLEDTRRQAIDRMVQNATLVGANAVISMRFDSSELAGTMSEIVAYGTAVVVVPDAARGRQAHGVGAMGVHARAGADRRPRGRAACSAGSRRRGRGAGRRPVLVPVPVRPGRRPDRRGRSSSGLRYRSLAPRARATATARAAASRRPRSRASGRPTSASWTRRRASRCGSGWTPDRRTAVRRGGLTAARDRGYGRTDRAPPHRPC